MTNKTPIDLINDIHALLTEQSAQIRLLQKSVDLLGAKVNGELFPGKPPTFVPPIVESSVPTPPAPTVPAPVVATETPAPTPAIKSPRKSTRVFGSVKQYGKGISGVSVVISDTNNIVVKKTNTNAAGQWVAFLPAGVYSAEFIAPGSMPELRIMEIIEGQKEYEVK
jgi:hypothetical protein